MSRGKHPGANQWQRDSASRRAAWQQRLSQSDRSACWKVHQVPARAARHDSDRDGRSYGVEDIREIKTRVPLIELSNDLEQAKREASDIWRSRTGLDPSEERRKVIPSGILAVVANSTIDCRTTIRGPGRWLAFSVPLEGKSNVTRAVPAAIVCVVYSITTATSSSRPASRTCSMKHCRP